MLEILEGSIVIGKSGRLMEVISTDEDVLILKSADGDLVKARRSAILEVISPPIEISPLEVGDRVRRLPHQFQGQYIPAVPAATVERISVNGVWVRTDQPDSKVYHVSDVAFDEGWWERITDD
jgi:hypothetical protein